MNQKLERYNDDTKMFVVYSTATGEAVFYGKVKGRRLRSLIVRAIRMGEDLSFENAKTKIMELLENK